MYIMYTHFLDLYFYVPSRRNDIPSITLHQYHLSLTSQPPALHLRKRLRSTKENDNAYYTSNRQDLEQRPIVVVEEEQSLHRHDRPEEEGVRNWSRAGSFTEIREIGSEVCPL